MSATFVKLFLLVEWTRTRTGFIERPLSGCIGKKIPVQDVAQNYYNTYIERGVLQLLTVRDLSRFQAFIRLCAGRTGTKFNASALSNAIEVSVPTIQDGTACWKLLISFCACCRFQKYQEMIGQIA